MDFAADPLGSLVAIIFVLLGAAAWILALRKVATGEGIGIQERWGGFGHGLGGWQVTPAFALTLVGASAIGIGVTVLQRLPERTTFRDHDADGVLDDDDQCPAALEDFDGYEDRDGCPDPDNDGDGILDAKDECPLHPEDVDGIDDANGCPDP
ncbi:hypothetical protein [Paraliomyxa miuraensis]|uniref:hypothetical protein n=1 Tax=Paraliomyxa miuraensis TaxID=376150 RepID=UPI002B1CC8CE|nr:hypothetical protein [Paraliomyxa miuraensis]